MPRVTLEGDTLGKKHQHYNKLVEDAIANKHYELCNISVDDSDIDNLLKIGIASKNRNVDYIIEVMKCNDMLYAATAIKKSTWLITEQQYSNIINPEYLQTQLLPSMNMTTFNKLMLHIRLNLKDESRVEAFYGYFKDTDRAYKWLQNCSIPFIENVIKNERSIPLSTFKRLCRRSAHFIAYYTRVNTWTIHGVKKECLFLLKSHSAELLKVLEHNNNYCFPRLGKKKTEILMNICPQKVFDNFEKYVFCLDLSIVAKFLNKKEIKAFLYGQMKKSIRHYLCYFENLSPFLENMLEEEKFEFVKKTFIDKTELAAFYPQYEEEKINQHIKVHQWYEFAPFNVAFPELKKFLRIENSSFERCAMLTILITCARRNAQHIKTLLTFVKEKHINEPFHFKIEFVNNLLSQISTHKMDVESWNVLDQLFHSMEVYTESENDVQTCVESIVLYKVLHDEPVPEILEQKMTFNTFEKVQNKLNQKQRSKIFTYLLNSVSTKLHIGNIANEDDFNETIVNLKNALTLLRDWKKDISKYPFVLEKIQELNNKKKENMWKTDMTCLYNVKKSFRKHMFEESLDLCLNEEACLNALKHKPQLLTRHDKEINTLRTNDAVSLRRLLTKLRVYWPHSLAQHWTDAYLLNLNQPTGQKAVIEGLFRLFTQNQIIDMAKKYAPDDFKINWCETDQAKIRIRKNIARNLYVARPLIPVDTVLLYANRDYLQHAVPSLNAILYNMSEDDCREHLPKLLNAPVPLQKFGLHLVYLKLKCDDLKSIFLDMWDKSKNVTIRSALFKHTYAKMCKVKDPKIEQELWEILSIFITSDESGEIYKRFSNIQNVPASIRAEFYMKSYEFLSSLPASANYSKKYLKYLMQYAPKIMESLSEDFVVNKMLSPVGTKFCSYGSEVLEVFACYVLCGKNEEDQFLRFRRVVEPAMEEAFHLWDSTRCGHYYVRDNFNNFLSALVWNFRIYFLTLNEITSPFKLFEEIKTKIETGLPLLENYVLHTSWNIVTEYVRAMDELGSTFIEFDSNRFIESDIRRDKDENRWMSNEMDSVWIDIHSKISPLLGPVIAKCLKEDTEQYNSSTIYCLFTEAFTKMFNELFTFRGSDYLLETLKHIINDSDFVPSYFLVSKMTPKDGVIGSSCEIRSEIRNKLKSHPSKAVRMHYYNDFRDVPEDYEITTE